MSELPNQPPIEGKWAQPVSKLRVTELPAGAISINVNGRQVTSALQGFGQLWQKTYRVRLPGLTLTPAEAMGIWKAEFPNFQPPDSQFYPSLAGIQAGQMIFVNLNLPVVPGLPNMIPVGSGVLVLYADDVSFTVMTPEGFPVSGWNTFSIYQEEGCLVAQVQSLDRATDPIYEFGTRVMGGAQRQEDNWTYVLTALAGRLGIHGQPQMFKECIDPRWQWSEAKNVWKNAGVRTFFYRLAAPVRWLANKGRRQKGEG